MSNDSGLPTGPHGSLSYDLYNQQDMCPTPQGEPSNKAFFDWSQRAKVMEDRITDALALATKSQTPEMFLKFEAILAPEKSEAAKATP